MAGFHCNSACHLALAVESAQGRITHDRILIRGKSKLNQAEEVCQNFGISLHASLPVFVDTSLQGLSGIDNRLGMRRSVVVVPSLGVHVLKMVGMSLLPPIRE
jgi:hypothetical protein